MGFLLKSSMFTLVNFEMLKKLVYWEVYWESLQMFSVGLENLKLYFRYSK